MRKLWLYNLFGEGRLTALIVHCGIHQAFRH